MPTQASQLIIGVGYIFLAIAVGIAITLLILWRFYNKTSDEVFTETYTFHKIVIAMVCSFILAITFWLFAFFMNHVVF